MSNPIALTVFPVKDIAKAKAFYTVFFGTEPYADSPYYVGYKIGNQEVGLDPNGQDVIAYIESNDIEASILQVQSAGGQVESEPRNVGGGLLVAKVRDSDGNMLGFRQLPT